MTLQQILDLELTFSYALLDFLKGEEREALEVNVRELEGALKGLE